MCLPKGVSREAVKCVVALRCPVARDATGGMARELDAPGAGSRKERGRASEN